VRPGRTRIQARIAAILLTLVMVGAPFAGPATAAPGAPTDRAATGDAGSAPGGSLAGTGSRAAATLIDPFGGAPAPDALPASSSPVEPTLDEASPGGEPTIQYEEALAHEADPDTFTPGGRVSVAYTPRADDGWAVGGTSPRALPAGNTTGLRMAASKQGSLWASRPPADLADPSAGAGAGPGQTAARLTSPVDGPAGRPVAGIPLSATVPAPDVNGGDAAARGLRRQVFGFLPYWTLGDRTTVLDYDYLSTIAYFSVGADRLGNLLKRNANGSPTTGWGGWTSKRMTSVINAAHAHHTRVVLTISVFAWTSGGAAKQGALLGSPAARRNLARQAAAAVRDRGADGINLDFEPIASGHADDFTAFVRTLRRELDRVHRGYQLTFDTTGWIGNYPIEDATAPGGADAIFIMGYDYRGSGASTAGSIDPLSGSTYALDDTIRAYTARVPASKLILGLPYYGRAWSTTTSTLRATNQSGSKYGTSNAVTYSAAAALVKVYGRRYDATEGVTWFVYRRKNCTTTYGCLTSWRQVYFDDPQSLKARYDLVIRSRLRGAGVWALGYEGRDPSLYGAISLKFLHDTTPPEAGIAILPATTGDAGFVVAWRAADDSAIRSYDVQVSVDGGAWTPWRSGTKATSDVFLGADGHGYAFRVRATDAYRNIGAWDVGARYDPTPSVAPGGFGRVRVDGLSARVSPDTSALKVATFSAGQIVAILGGPIGADGYTWYKVAGPLSEWNSVAFTRSGIWVPVRSASASFVGATQAPSATGIDAGIDPLRIGSAGVAGPAAFSPDRNGSGDTLHLAWRNHLRLDSIALRVYRLDGSLVGTRKLAHAGAGDQAYDWDGSLAGVGRVPDGRYVLQLVGTAGSRTYSAPSARPVTPIQVGLYSAVIDRVPPPVTAASASGARISPNGDGRFERLTFALSATSGAAWDLSIARLTGATAGPAVRTVTGTGGRALFTWDGRANGGALVPDGTYRVTLRVADAAGNRSARAWTVVVDDRPAVIGASAGPSPISPNGDKVSDSAVLRWASDEAVRGAVTVRRGGHVIRSWSFTTRSGGTIGWNGRDARGRPAPDGMYRIRVDGLDATGNRTIVERTVVVDRTAGFLRWSTAAFDPQDGDALLPTSRLSFRLVRTARVSLAIVDDHGLLVRTVWAARTMAAGARTWTWDGRAANGAFVAPGTYTAILSVTSSLGTTTLRRTVFAGAFRVVASATTLSPGRTLTLTFRAVEPLRGTPVVTFRQKGHAAVARTATRLADGSYRVSFLVRPGSGPASAVISAIDTKGHADRQTVILVVR
jgi:spore germination protein YaaH/flagellar hook assembly protein FlgD